jgi:PAS domain S-box-containing protein
MARRLVVLAAVILNAVFLFLDSRYEVSTAWIVLISAANITFLILLNYMFSHALREFYLLTGNATKSTSFQTAIKDYLLNARELIGETKHVIASINEIGASRFSALVKAIKSDEIRSSLCSANDKIQMLRKQEQDGNRIAQGVASIAELKQKGNDVAAYGDQVLSVVIKYLNANQGGFFIVKNEEENFYLELVASYAYGKRRYNEKRINPGEGLTGQVLLEQQIVYITNIPKDYIKITSGIGEALPTCICILPLIFDGTICGVLEIASFQKLEATDLEYLKKISESIGYNLSSIESQRKTEVLLEESQKMAHEVRVQEEELRQNMEELQATQEQMKKKEYEMEAVLASLSTVDLDTDGKIMDANEIFLSITGFKNYEIVGRPYRSLISSSGNGAMQYELMLSNILSGRTFSGEFKIVSSTQKEIWMAGNFTPILNAHGKPYKIMVVSVFTTQDKEKLLELQEMLAALKSCFPIAEINPDVSFKTANDLFLSELGVRRLDLKKYSLKSIMNEESFIKVEKHILGSDGAARYNDFKYSG